MSPYFHGGTSGLSVGEILVPANRLGPSCHYLALEHPRSGLGVHHVR